MTTAMLRASANESEIRGRYRRFAQDQLIGQETCFDNLPEPRHRATAQLEAEGLANWWLPTAYGGLGLSLRESVDVVSELAYADAGFAFGSFLPVLAGVILRLYGDPALTEAAFSALGARGGTLAVMGSEKSAGSELARTETTFSPEGDHLVLSGSKLFSTNADAADLILVLARSSAHDDYAMIALPRDTVGLSIVGRWDMVGMRGSATYQGELRGCTVPASHRLRGNGLRVLEVGLNASRILIAATAVGISRRIRDLAMEYGGSKEIKAAALRENAVFAGHLGQMESTIDVMRNECLAAAAELDACLDSPDAAATLYRRGTLRGAITSKLFCGQAGWQVASQGSQMFGGLGYTNEHLIGKLVRDMRYVSIVEGGEDVLRELMYGRYVIPPLKRV